MDSRVKLLNETIQDLELELNLCQRQLQQYQNNQMEEISNRTYTSFECIQDRVQFYT